MHNVGWLGLVIALSTLKAEAESSSEQAGDSATTTVAIATTVAAAGETAVVLPAVTIIGAPDAAAKIAGSAQVLDAETLRASRVFTTSEALRKLPGVNVRDEEGFGLRPNIGIRGLNPTRSSKTLLLEDGIPITYGVYGENASYYHPPIERFDRIEVLKGAGVNLYGPTTIGGVINYITPIPGQALSAGLSLAGGNRDYFNGHGTLSGLGQRADYVRKQGDGARDNTRLATDDANYKGLFALGDHNLITRVNYYRENSQVSYSGITEAEFRNFGARYNPFENDRFDAYRWGASLTDEWTLSRATLTTNFYFANFARNWWRQSSNTTDGQCGATFTNARLNGQTVDSNACNSIQGRVRDYYSAGVEPRLKLPYTVFGVENELQTGVRYHYERQDRLQINSTVPTGRDGSLVENNRRESDAISGYAQNEIRYGDFTFAPGVRVEYVDYFRRNLINAAEGSTDLTKVLYSFSGSYAITERLTGYTGVHKGFAPPSTADIIDNNGGVAEVNAESSVNFEAGLRSRPVPGVALEATYFRNDFSNLIAVGQIAGGNLPLAQGKALFEGLELSGRADFGRWLPGTHNPFFVLAYTLLPTAEQSSALIRVDNGATVPGSAAGRRLPYAPRHNLTTTLGYSHSNGFEGRLEAVYIGTQASDFANTDASAANGLSGKISGATVWNLALNYAVPNSSFGVFFAMKNLFDHTYIVDRTRGIVPGAPRLIQGGVEYRYD